MKKRGLLGMFLLTVVTFGFYAIYWNIMFQVELKKETGEGFNGLGHFLLLLVTFGIYYIYWNYAAGKRLAIKGADDQSVVYLILSLLSLGYINMFLMQNQANQL